MKKVRAVHSKEFKVSTIRMMESKGMWLFLVGVFALGVAAGAWADDPARKVPTKPLTIKDLVGTWRGERDGIKVELVVKADGQSNWRVERNIPAGGKYHTQADLQSVDDDKSGGVELRFHRRPEVKPPVVLVGRIARGPSGAPMLTIPTESEQYPAVKDLPLEPARDGK